MRPPFRLAAAAYAGLLLSVACRAGGHAEALLPPAGTGEPVVIAQSAGDRLDGRNVVAARTISAVPAFSVLTRQSELSKAPCANCHTVPVAALIARRPGAERRAHWNVTLAHAPDSVMTCATCHLGPDLAGLRLLEGQPVSFDHAYEVCAQCHSPQRRDWEGGAHGKRAGGWAPPRVVYGCTECHDPHRPAFGLRWPARAGEAR